MIVCYQASQEAAARHVAVQPTECTVMRVAKDYDHRSFNGPLHCFMYAFLIFNTKKENYLKVYL